MSDPVKPATPVATPAATVAKKPTIFSSVETWGFAHWTYIVTALVGVAVGHFV